MDLSSIDWKKILGTVAPAMASAVGTPALGAVVGMLSTAIFGTADAPEQDVATAIAGGHLTGEQLAAIRKADNDFKVQMQQIAADMAKVDAETERAYLADVQNARERQIATKDHVPEIILGIAFAFYALQLLLFYFGKMPVDEFTRALVVRAFGTIDGILLTCVAFFVGSSRGSKSSSETVRRIAEHSAK